MYRIEVALLLSFALLACSAELAPEACSAALQLPARIVGEADQRFRQALCEGFSEAKRRLQEVCGCWQGLGFRSRREAVESLGTLRIRPDHLGGILPIATIERVVFQFLMALVTPRGDVIVLDVEFYQEPPVILAAFLDAARYRFRMPGLELVTWTAATLLHEMGHYYLGWPNDVGRPEEAMENQGRVLEACFRDLRTPAAAQPPAVHQVVR